MAAPLRGFAALAAAIVVGALVAAHGPAGAQAPAAGGDFGGYATGTVVHAHALQQAQDVRAANVDVAFSGASADSGGLGSAVTNEMDRVVQPTLDGKQSYGRGSAVEVGLGLEPPSAENNVTSEIDPLAPATASAPPSSKLVTNELGSTPPDTDPLVYGRLLRGQAQARWGPASCVLDHDLAFGHGEAADVELADQDQTGDEVEGLEQPLLATNAPNPERQVVSSTSRVRMVPQVSRDGAVEGNALGVMSETRMTVAPVTVNLGNAQVYTVELLGEWVLRAVATGHSGWVHYGPGETSPETPILRVVNQLTNEIEGQITTQQFFEDEGLVIEPDPNLSVALGEDPRAIGGNAESAPTESATEAAGAVDVVRLVVGSGDPGTLVDLRIGHMEARATAPDGGVTCDLPVTKAPDKDTVAPGEQFTYTITVDNPYDCTLTDVKVVDKVSATPGTTFVIEGASDGGTVSGDTVTWPDVGPIEPGADKSVTIAMRAGPDSAAGTISDVVDVTANCGLAGADGSTDVVVPVSGQARVDLPNVAPTQVAGITAERPEPQPQGALPRTGGAVAGLAGLALLGGGAWLRRLTRSPTGG